MYKKYLPDVLPDRWALSELDEENCYLEFLSFNGEYLVPVMEHPGEYILLLLLIQSEPLKFQPSNNSLF
jgi:hypothetical protein